jgi:hypothetical protein
MGESVREYRPQILHEPNMASGGQAMRIEVGDFLVREAHGPQHAELLRLIKRPISSLRRRRRSLPQPRISLVSKASTARLQATAEGIKDAIDT